MTTTSSRFFIRKRFVFLVIISFPTLLAKIQVLGGISGWVGVGVGPMEAIVETGQHKRKKS